MSEKKMMSKGVHRVYANNEDSRRREGEEEESGGEYSDK
jgi:hypothetical protein